MGRVGRGHCFQLLCWFSNDHENVFTIFPIFLKVLELSECRRGDLYVTANRFASLIRENIVAFLLVNVEKKNSTINIYQYI